MSSKQQSKSPFKFGPLNTDRNSREDPQQVNVQPMTKRTYLSKQDVGNLDDQEYADSLQSTAAKSRHVTPFTAREKQAQNAKKHNFKLKTVENTKTSARAFDNKQKVGAFRTEVKATEAYIESEQAGDSKQFRTLKPMRQRDDLKLQSYQSEIVARREKNDADDEEDQNLMDAIEKSIESLRKRSNTLQKGTSGEDGDMQHPQEKYGRQERRDPSQDTLDVDKLQEAQENIKNIKSVGNLMIENERLKSQLLICQK